MTYLKDDIIHVSISKGNTKMGAVPSVSLPAIITCRKGCACCKYCYAAKLERLRKTVREAYQRNLEILKSNPKQYWKEVSEAVKTNRFFRFHVSGDIPSYDYFVEMVEVAYWNPHCEILCFTKRYDIVNQYVDNGGAIWENLHIIFSADPNLEMDNPYNLPEAHIRFRDGSCTAGEDAVECYGNCTECFLAGCGCWKLKNGEQVVFNQH